MPPLEGICKCMEAVFWLSKWPSLKLAFRGQEPGILNRPGTNPHRKDCCTQNANISLIVKQLLQSVMGDVLVLVLFVVVPQAPKRVGLSKCWMYIVLFVQSILHTRLFILSSHLDIVCHSPPSLLTLFWLRLSNSVIIVYIEDFKGRWWANFPKSRWRSSARLLLPSSIFASSSQCTKEAPGCF